MLIRAWRLGTSGEYATIAVDVKSGSGGTGTLGVDVMVTNYSAVIIRLTD